MAHPRSSRVAPFLGAAALMLASGNAWGQACPFNALQIDPPAPGASDPVTVIVSMDCGNACLAPCDLTLELVAEGHYHITAFVHDSTVEFAQQGITCTEVVVTYDQEVVLGVLAATDYLVTADVRVGPSGEPCANGATVGQTSTTFVVAALPIPAAGMWRLGAQSMHEGRRKHGQSSRQEGNTLLNR